MPLNNPGASTAPLSSPAPASPSMRGFTAPVTRFKGYMNFVVQDLVMRSHVVNFRRERWQSPDGAAMTAPLPDGISGHFGPELRRFVLAQYHQGQVTIPRLLALLRAFGILISKRQLM